MPVHSTIQRAAKGPYIKDVRSGRGGSPKEDIVREVAWIYKGEGVKKP